MVLHLKHRWKKPLSLNLNVSSLTYIPAGTSLITHEFNALSICLTALETSDSKVFAIKQEFKGHTGPVYVSKFSSANHLIASGSFDKTVRIWDTHAQTLTSKEAVSLVIEYFYEKILLNSLRNIQLKDMRIGRP